MQDTDTLYENTAVILGQLVKEGLPEDMVQEILNRLSTEANIEDLMTILKHIGDDIQSLAL